MFQNARIVCRNANPEAYHNQDSAPGTKGFAVSSGSLRTFAQCPARFRSGYRPPESAAKDYGSLLDCMVLTPELFVERYAVQPENYENEKGDVKPWNNNAKVCRQWRKKHEGLEIVTASELATAKAAKSKLSEDSIISDWLAACDFQTWVAGEWKDEETDLVVPVRCLIDCEPRPDTEFSKCLGDLKTTRNAALIPWQRFCYQMGYYIQAAWDIDLYVAATEQDRNTWCWILQENYEPWQTARRMMSQDFLTLGRAEYRQAMSNYCQCLKSGVWPGYDDHDEAVQGWSLVSPMPWMSSEAQFAPKYEFANETQESEPENLDIIP